MGRLSLTDIWFRSFHCAKRSIDIKQEFEQLIKYLIGHKSTVASPIKDFSNNILNLHKSNCKKKLEAKESRQPLEADKDREIDSPIKPLEGMQSCRNF